jgi:RimJ/RimL family protein N-acetyltransferase
LYEQAGFLVEGIKRKGRKLDGTYDDVIFMAKLEPESDCSPGSTGR